MITCARAEAEWHWKLQAHRLAPDSHAARLAAMADEQAKLAAWLSAESLWDVLTPFEAPLM
jgi:hypothetical protein